MKSHDDILREKINDAYYQAQKAEHSDQTGIEKVLLRKVIDLASQLNSPISDDCFLVAHACYELAMVYIAEKNDERAFYAYLGTIEALVMYVDGPDELEETEYEMLVASGEQYHRLRQKVNPALPELSIFADREDSDSDSDKMEIDTNTEKNTSFNGLKS